MQRISYPDYHCPHRLTTATSSASRKPFVRTCPSPSSGYDFHPLASLYFCDSCDAIRCPSCVVEEVTTYFCPNCLFEVSSGSVRTEKTRCARNCFLCPVPSCTAVLTVTTVEQPGQNSDAPPKYTLRCPACKWSGADVGPRWMFDKPNGIGHQVLDREKTSTEVLEYESLQNHFDRYLYTLRSALGTGSGDAPGPSYPTGALALGKRQPSRNTAAAAIAAKLAARKVSESRFFTKAEDRIKPKKPKFLPIPKSEDPPNYTSKRPRNDGLDRSLHPETAEVGQNSAGKDDISLLRQIDGLSLVSAPLPLETIWSTSFAPPISPRQLVPERIPLRAKMSKRCTACNHTLIRPESKAQSLRWKIKTLASTYIPTIELGNRRRLVDRSVEEPESSKLAGGATGRGLGEEKESLHTPLATNVTYAYQLAFTNPLLEATSIKLSVGHVQPTSQLRITMHDLEFELGAFSEPWELEAATADDKTRSRLGGGTKTSRTAVERKGNITKVPFWAHIGSQASSTLKFDLNVDFTYQSDDATQSEQAPLSRTEEDGMKPPGSTWKTFTFHIRVNLGMPEIPS